MSLIFKLKFMTGQQLSNLTLSNRKWMRPLLLLLPSLLPNYGEHYNFYENMSQKLD